MIRHEKCDERTDRETERFEDDGKDTWMNEYPSRQDAWMDEKPDR